MADRDRWNHYIKDLRDEDCNSLFRALAKIKEDFQAYRGSSRTYFLRRNEGRCTIELNFNDGTTRICFNLTAISNKDLNNHSQIMANEDHWKQYLRNLGEQDRRDLFSVLAIMQGDYHMHRGESPSRHPPFLYRTEGKCRAVLNFKNGLTEFSFNSIIINNTEIDELFESLAGCETNFL